MDIEYLIDVLPVMLRGLRVTVEVTLLGALVALTLGLLVASIRVLGGPLLGAAARLYVTFIRNTPLLVQLFVVFYVAPQYGITLDATLLGIIGLGVHFSAYTAEVYRAGLEHVPRGQWDAAHALQLSRIQTLTRVVLPQGVPPIIPALGNYLISLFKDSAYLATITVVELLAATRELASASFKYTTLFTFMGILYLAVSIPAAAGVRYLEGRLGRL